MSARALVKRTLTARTPDAVLRARVSAASLLDRAEARGRRVLEKWGAPQAWLHDFQAYLAEPRITPEEFWVRYTLLRMKVQPALTAIRGQAEAEAFYKGSDYMLWRNVVHRRHSAWRRVLVTMDAGRRRAQPALWEVGCGIAPVSAWVAPRRPLWVYHLIDLPSPHRAYAAWRLQRPHRDRRCLGEARVHDAPPYAAADVVTLLDVLEHLADPLWMAKRCVDALDRGGYLHWNFVGNPLRNDLDLATEEQQAETTAYLYRELVTVYDRDGYRVGRKP